MLGRLLILLQSELTVTPINKLFIKVDEPVINDEPVSKIAIKLLGEFLQLTGGTKDEELEH